MIRWLLNTFPTWAIAFIVVGVLVLLTLAGLRMVRRVLPEGRPGDVNDYAGVMASVIAAFYGVVLAFAIVALYEEFHEAEQDVRTESVILARIVRDSAALPPAAAERVRTAVRDYRNAVVGPEWVAMEKGEHSDTAWRKLDGIYAAVARYEPRGERESAFYGEAVAAVNELVEARRARLHAAEASLPGILMVLLIGGAILTLGFTLVFGVSNRRLHTVMAVSLAVLLGFSLLVAFVLDHPFSGDVSVSGEPYHEGALEGL